MKCLVSVCLLVFMACESFGCLWDRDTLWMENKKFPMALELITGKFRRHSKHCYEWRQQEVLAMLKTNPKYLRLLDDLGVSYDKIGKHTVRFSKIVECTALLDNNRRMQVAPQDPKIHN